MEKNTVIINLTDYNTALSNIFKIQMKLDDATAEVKALQKDFDMLSVFAIRQAVIEWRIEKYPLEELLKFDGFTSAIGKDEMNTLINLGVPYSLIIKIIKEMKEEHDGNE